MAPPAPKEPIPPEVYHEPQRLLRCGAHAVNALLRRAAYTARDLDEIADSLAPEHPLWSHPHRAVLGLGNYDVNVLSLALARSGFQTEWLHADIPVTELVERPDVKGFLVNVPSRWVLPEFLKQFFVQRRHWIAVPRYGEKFYKVDSMLPGPVLFETTRELCEYLEKVCAEKGFVLYAQKTAEDDSS